ncbi:putative TIM-barrel fold enzyme [Tetragenococcus muriaticus PMC-11-5]|uniref:Putative TIM-barrel fold enzyme n=2 Tax=Tetragenococcus muriaticus TaxID=64642 RepID=A0A091BYR5_9ENTE|nr:putative TIM-barrel fold enzyme [Tetragenococcus muriaticus 3MR10-3]KFN91166.1 putative TIM-barrel fold enzyme [Tetragenococcus muriaticus PMC-11-5]
MQIINISAAEKTPEVVAYFRKLYPDLPIMATGGPTDENIRQTIQAGANAITYTPPSNGELFSKKMDLYRQQEIDKYERLQ